MEKDGYTNCIQGDITYGHQVHSENDPILSLKVHNHMGEFETQEQRIQQSHTITYYKCNYWIGCVLSSAANRTSTTLHAIRKQEISAFVHDLITSLWIQWEGIGRVLMISLRHLLFVHAA
ncbi:unnamed protein product [Albugo candida]|uniref:Uncharacterized protein n=1 Tax=Albugo candida TaxID=65357 RepID=A0A024GSW2_9STRA|nr:unnamed protein product [Albugo candida]|eukprot:CCI49878.1 unnamed protein product [Albugo candida]